MTKQAAYHRRNRGKKTQACKMLPLQYADAALSALQTVTLYMQWSAGKTASTEILRKVQHPWNVPELCTMGSCGWPSCSAPT